MTSESQPGPSQAPQTGRYAVPAADAREAGSTIPRGVREASEWTWRLLLLAAGAIALGYLFRTLSEVIVPMVVALLLAALLKPAHRRLSAVMPKGPAAGLTVLGTIAIVAALLALVGSQVSSQWSSLTTQVLEGVEQVRDWVKTTFGLTDTQFTEYLDKAKQAASESNLGDSAAKAGLTATHAIAGLFMALFALFFFLYEGDRMWRWAVRLAPHRARPKVDESGHVAWGQLSAFTRATIMVAAADATGIALGALILGVPFAAGIALIVFLGAFIPIVGALVSGSVAILLALVAKGPVAALIMLGIVIAVQQIESHVLQPFLMGRAVAVHPLAVILAIATGVILGGVVGALVAVPTVAAVNAVAHHLLDSPESHDDDTHAPVLDEEEEGGATAAHG
ncbi:MAG: AI-2E family transporter [Micrococcales bacterium]|nr:AI-2E family transporter [Micrococcales bacterium]